MSSVDTDDVVVIIDSSTEWVNHGSVIQATAYTADGTKRVTFAGDWRPMADVRAYVESTDEPVTTVLEGWQILRVEAVEEQGER